MSTPAQENLTAEQRRAIDEAMVYLNAGIRGDDQRHAIEDSLLALEAVFGILTMTRLQYPEELYAAPAGTQVHVGPALWGKIIDHGESYWQTRDDDDRLIDEATTLEFFQRVSKEEPLNVARWGYGEEKERA